MTKNTNANTNDPGSQRKRSANQSRANVASQNSQQSQQNNKKGNKQQNQNQNRNQSPAKSTSSAATTAAVTTTSPTAPAPVSLPAVPTTPTPTHSDDSYVPLAGFNGDDIDRLLKNGVDEKAATYKSEQPLAQQKTSPWGQKRGYLSGNLCVQETGLLTYRSRFDVERQRLLA